MPTKEQCSDCGKQTKGHGERCKSCANKKRWQDPDFRRKMSRALKAAGQAPELRRKRSENTRLKWQDPEYRHKTTKNIRVTSQTPESRRKRSDAAKLKWQDPKHRRKMSEAGKKKWENPEYCRKMSEIKKAMWEDPEWRRKTCEAMEVVLQDPKIHRRMSEAGKAKWQDPEYRRKKSEIAKTLWEDSDYRHRVTSATRAARRTPESRRKSSVATKTQWQDPEFRRKKSVEMIMRWKRGDFDGVFQSPTSIELEVMEVLDVVGLKHTPQYRPDNYSRVYDEFIPPNIFIEVNGDYWHGNPEIYADDDLTEKQQKRREGDTEKAQWAKENGYHLVILWENEIKELGAWPLIRNRVFPLCDMEKLLSTDSQGAEHLSCEI